MGISDGKAVLDSYARGGNNFQRQQNKNNDNDEYRGQNQRKSFNSVNKQQPSRNNNRTRKFNVKLDQTVLNSSYVSNREQSGKGDVYESNQIKRDKKDANFINEFVEDFRDSINNYNTMYGLVVDNAPTLFSILKGYYRVKMDDSLVDAMNALINVICIKPFSQMLKKALESEVWELDGRYETCWRDIVFGLSLVLNTSYLKMNDDVVDRYVNTILVRMLNAEITQLVNKTGIKQDLALDLYIALPFINWSNHVLDEYYGQFREKILIHAEDNADILDAEIQEKLFRTFFGQSNTLIKVIGKYFSDPIITEHQEYIQTAVDQEFITMLYNILDQQDIGTIEYCLQYVVNKRKELDTTDTLFDCSVASNYKNVKKALLRMLDKNQENKKYLV